MGYVSNSSVIASESNKLSLSTWVRIPSTQTINPGNLCGLIEWVEPITGGVQSNYIELQCTAPNQFVLSSDIVGVDRPRTPADFPGIDPVTLVDSINIGFDGAQVMNLDTWYHLLFGIDAGADLSRYSASSTINVLMNGVLVSTGGVNTDVIFDSGTLKLSGDGFRLAGKACGVPWISAGQSHNQRNLRVDLADFQLWYGLYIDPTNAENFAKFVTVSGGVGRPASPLAAANFFGEQTFLFSGKASDASFYTNRGTGGSFAITGTGSDIAGPSYS